MIDNLDQDAAEKEEECATTNDRHEMESHNATDDCDVQVSVSKAIESTNQVLYGTCNCGERLDMLEGNVCELLETVESLQTQVRTPNIPQEQQMFIQEQQQQQSYANLQTHCRTPNIPQEQQMYLREHPQQERFATLTSFDQNFAEGSFNISSLGESLNNGFTGQVYERQIQADGFPSATPAYPVRPPAVAQPNFSSPPCELDTQKTYGGCTRDQLQALVTRSKNYSRASKLLLVTMFSEEERAGRCTKGKIEKRKGGIIVERKGLADQEKLRVLYQIVQERFPGTTEEGINEKLGDKLKPSAGFQKKMSNSEK